MSAESSGTALELDHTLPPVGGWATVAAAVHAIHQLPTPVVVRIAPSGRDPIVVDLARHVFSWPDPWEAFPTRPERVEVATDPSFPGAPPVFPLPGRPLDPLWWLIGYHAFGDAPAPWLRSEQRVRLSRWPDLAELPIDLDQVRMIAIVGNTAVTADELAHLAGSTLGAAHRILNAFGVMGILRAVATAAPRQPDASNRPPSAARPPTASDEPLRRDRSHRTAPPAGGLFARLRSRLGL